MAMETIFKDPYRINLDFVDRRNTTECDITFERNGHIISKPKQSSGLGAVDVGAFALRIAAWSIQNPKTRNFLIQDEPFKHLKGERENILVIEMVQELSKRLGLQVIMIHDERVPLIEIEKGADKVISVSKKCGKSKAIEL